MAAPAKFCLKKNDRIVFLGDSITEQQLYTNYVETYLATRFRSLNLTFFNAGWGGDTAPGGARRLDRDVLALKPTVVTVCYGMNDGCYTAPNPGILERYAAGMNDLVRRLKDAGVRIVLLTPGMTDMSRNENHRKVDYSGTTLRMLADFVLDLAAREALPVFDIHRLMTEVDARARAADPSFTMIPDSVHPDPAGQLVMAYGLLQAMGVPPLRATAELDLAAGSAACTGDVGVSGLRADEHGYEFSLTLNHLPFFVEPAARKILPFLPFQETYNSLTLTCRGAAAERYFFKIGNTRSESLERDALAAGLPFFSLWSAAPVAAAGKLHQFTQEKDQMYFRLWRMLALQGGSGSDYIPAVHAAALKAMPALDKARTEMMGAGPLRYTVRMLETGVPGEPLDDGDFIRTWSFRGPFPCTAATEGDDFLGGEDAMTRQVPVLPCEWVDAELDVDNPPMALTAFYGPREDCCAYLLTVIESPVEQAASLLVGSDDGFALWLNGEELADQVALRRGLAVDQDRIPVRLRRGANVLMIKVSQGGGGWGVCVRFSGLAASVAAVRPRRPGMTA